MVKEEQDPSLYRLSPKDYYRDGCTTILNSESAALCKCLEIERQVLQGKKTWRDPDFGPLSDKQGGAFSIYYDGQDQDHLPSKLEDIEWQRPEQYLADIEDATKPVFIKAGSSSNEVK